MRRSAFVRMMIFTTLFVGGTSTVVAKNCKKGIPCGNSCIAVGKTCRIGSYAPSSYKNHSYSYPSSSIRSSQSNNSRKTEGVKTTPAAKNYLCQYSIASIENGRLGALRVQGYAQVTLYADSFKANRLNGTYLISPKLNANGKFMMADDKSKVYAYDSWLLNFAISDRITRTTEQWDRCKLNQK